MSVNNVIKTTTQNFTKTLAVVALAMTSLVACSNIKDTAEQPVELEPIQATWSINRVWQRNLGGGQGKTVVDLSPVVRDDRVYAVNTKGRVFAFNAQTGKSQWRVDTKKHFSAGLGVNDSALFLGEQNGAIIALDIDSGQTLWQKQLNTETSVSPVANDDYVIVLGANGTVFCLSTDGGELVWSKKLNVPKLSLKGNARPFLIGGVVYLGLDNGQVLALSLVDGRTAWRTTIGVQRGRTELDRLADVDMLTVDLDGALFASSYSGSTVLMNPTNGQLGWQRDIPSSSTAQVDADGLYLVDDISKVWKLDKRSGKTLWLSNKLRARGLSGIASVEGVVLVSDYEGYVHLLDTASGQIVGRKQLLDSAVSGDIQYAGGLFYALTREGKLLAIKLTQPLS